MNFVFDAPALLTLFRGDAGAESVLARLRVLATDKDARGYVSVLAVGEIYTAVLRSGGERAATLVLEDLATFPLEVVDADYNTTLEAARLRSQHVLTAADAYTAALALRLDAALVAASEALLGLPLSVGLRVEVV